MKMHCYNLKIGDIHIRIVSDSCIETETAFSRFAVSEDETTKPDYTVRVRLVPELQIPEGECVYQSSGIFVLKTKEEVYFRLLKDICGNKENYAMSCFHWKKKEIYVDILKERKHHAESMRRIFKCIAWEVILLQEKRLILHASYLKTPYGGIAFSGPSGIGKTTQARLWCSYQTAEMLNGDKVILNKQGECWIGYGSPYAGSSGCYVNDQCELKYLVFLKQGETCRLRKLSLSETFKEIYAGLTLNRWDLSHVQRACELVESLAADIQAYEFTCTPDEAAVSFLKNHLEGGKICESNG